MLNGMSLKKIRENRKMSQRSLANFMGVSPAAVAQWETGANSISTENLIKLADALGCTIDALFGREESA